MSELRPFNTDAKREPLSAERIEEIIAEDRVLSEAADDEARKARLAGLRCSCCDEPLPADHLGPECAECQTIAD